MTDLHQDRLVFGATQHLFGDVLVRREPFLNT
jgi:hypothetical protein